MGFPNPIVYEEWAQAVQTIRLTSGVLVMIQIGETETGIIRLHVNTDQEPATAWTFKDGSPAVPNMPLAIADPPEPEPGLYACSGCGWRFERRTAMGSVWRGAMWGDKFGGQHGGPYSWDELTDAYGDCVGRLVLVDESKTAKALAKLLEDVINHIPEQEHRKVSRWREQLARLRP
jgi:hypothetical protein